jgi:hypothetical protein
MLDKASLRTPTTLSEKAVYDISQALMVLLSDVFALYLKTKNFHWHMFGPHFRDYHLMLDDQGEPSEHESWEAQRFVRSDISRVFNVSWITMLNT